MAKKVFSVPFPIKGLNTESPAYLQPDGTTPSCLNVMPYDSKETRARGGSRPGLDTYSSPVSGSNRIQDIRQAVKATERTTSPEWSTAFSAPDDFDGTESHTNTEYVNVAWHPSGDWVVASYSRSNAGDLFVGVYSFDKSTGVQLHADESSDFSMFSGNIQSMAFNSAGDRILTSSDAGRVAVWTFSDSTGDVSNILSEIVLSLDPSASRMGWLGSSNYFFGYGHSDETISIYEIAAGPSINQVDSKTNALFTFSLPTSNPAGTALILHDAAFDTIAAWVTDPDNGTFGSRYSDFDLDFEFPDFEFLHDIEFSQDGAYVFAVISTTDDEAKFVAIPFDASTGFGSADVATSVFPYEPVTGATRLKAHPSQNLVALMTGNLTVDVSKQPLMGVIRYEGDAEQAWNNLVTVADQWPVGMDKYVDSRQSIAWHPDADHVAFLGRNRDDRHYLQVQKFKSPLILPIKRQDRLVAVAGGNIKLKSDATAQGGFAQLSGGTGAVRTDGERVRSVSTLQKMFFCDGIADNYVYLDYADDTVKDWATDVTGGSLPAGSDDTTQGCDIIELYRGRVVMSGQLEEPHNWFASAVNDAFDWDYSPSTTTATQAVAGNNSNAGELGDITTALAAAGDDEMLMGGLNSLWVMRGDPAAGGVIDNVSRGVGIVQPDAWTFDDRNLFYFLAESGVYVANRAGNIESLTEGRVYRTFSRFDIVNDIITLRWDFQRQGLWVFRTPVDVTSTATNFFWDKRTDSWWEASFPQAHGPVTAYNLDADAPNFRILLFGGFDGQLRYLNENRSEDVTDEDTSSSIDTRVVLPALYAQNARSDMALYEIEAVLGRDSGDVELEVYAADSADDVLRRAIFGTDVTFVKNLVGDRNHRIIRKLRTHGLAFRLQKDMDDNSGAWTFEQMNVVADPAISKARLRSKGS